MQFMDLVASADYFQQSLHADADLPIATNTNTNVAIFFVNENICRHKLGLLRNLSGKLQLQVKQNHSDQHSQKHTMY